MKTEEGERIPRTCRIPASLARVSTQSPTALGSRLGGLSGTLTIIGAPIKAGRDSDNSDMPDSSLAGRGVNTTADGLRFAGTPETQ